MRACPDSRCTSAARSTWASEPAGESSSHRLTAQSTGRYRGPAGTPCSHSSRRPDSLQFSRRRLRPSGAPRGPAPWHKQRPSRHPARGAASVAGDNTAMGRRRVKSRGDAGLRSERKLQCVFTTIQPRRNSPTYYLAVSDNVNPIRNVPGSSSVRDALGLGMELQALRSVRTSPGCPEGRSPATPGSRAVPGGSVRQRSLLGCCLHHRRVWCGSRRMGPQGSRWVNAPRPR
jgi:hypothetical protein